MNTDYFYEAFDLKEEKEKYRNMQSVDRMKRGDISADGRELRMFTPWEEEANCVGETETLKMKKLLQT